MNTLTNIIIVISIVSVFVFVFIIGNVISQTIFPKELTLEEKQSVMAESIYQERQQQEVRDIKTELANDYLNNLYGVNQS